ncbi:MAG TPA: zinc finger domain-containing protein, partial [Candidatus Dormibacteraeota bacterium]|nr:zinc finger domain-containing protein [Candidatus Dormibacteraeota bacterium]
AQRGPLAARLLFDGGLGLDMTEQGTEKRLAMYVVRSPDDVVGVARLGIDACDPALTRERLSELLAESRGTVKSALADQSVIAGIGNAYSDEILHAARLSPFRTASRLEPAELEALHAAIGAVLGEAMARALEMPATELRDSKRSSMRVHGRTGQPCPVCGATVREVSMASRSFQYCPGCQTGGKVYADRRLSKLLR